MPPLRVKNVFYLPLLGTNYVNVGVSLQPEPGLGLALIKGVHVRMLMDSLGSLTLPALPPVCLPAQAHQHKAPSVELLCANWTVTLVRPHVPLSVVSVMSDMGLGCWLCLVLD